MPEYREIQDPAKCGLAPLPAWACPRAISEAESPTREDELNEIRTAYDASDNQGDPTLWLQLVYIPHVEQEEETAWFKQHRKEEHDIA